MAAPDVLRSFVGSAVLAPSSHNTQPWRFRLEEGRVQLYADRTRALPVNDPDDRELTISCGAAWFNVRVAAAHAGAGFRSTLLPDANDPDLLARGTISEASTEATAALFDEIGRRCTYRRRFANRPVADGVLARLAEAAAAEGVAVEVLGDAARRAVVELVGEGDRRQFQDVRWRRELAAWMHPRRRGDGLVVPALAAPATRFVVRHVDVGRGTARKDAGLAERAPALLVLTTDGDGPIEWLRAGQALQRILLTGCTAGLQGSYLNQPVQVEDLRPRVADLLDGHGAPQVILRIGYPTRRLPPAPRRRLDAVIEPVG